jgi:hypothetical protein
MSEHLRILLEKLETLAGGRGMPTHESSCDKYHPELSVSTLGVKLPKPDEHGMFHKDQFKLRDLEKARAAVNNKNPTPNDVDLLILFDRFNDQQNTIAKKNARLERHKAEHERYAHAQATEKKRRKNAHVQAARADFHDRWKDLLEREREAEHNAMKEHHFPWE